MTLKEAIVAVDQEYNMEVRTLTRESFAEITLQIESDFIQIEECEDVVHEIIGEVRSHSDLHRVVCMALRFGMRVQRKLDNPTHITTSIKQKEVVQ